MIAESVEVLTVGQTTSLCVQEPGSTRPLLNQAAFETMQKPHLNVALLQSAKQQELSSTPIEALSKYLTGNYAE